MSCKIQELKYSECLCMEYWECLFVECWESLCGYFYCKIVANQLSVIESDYKLDDTICLNVVESDKESD